MKTKLAAIVLAACFSSGAMAANQEVQPSPDEAQLYSNMRLLQAYAGEDKRAFIGEQLQLDDKEAAKFWPVFEAHQKVLSELNKRRLDNILAYARAWNEDALDDRRAAELAKQALAIEDDETGLLKQTYRKLEGVLPATKAVSYLQLENKIRAVVRYEQAVNVPILMP